MSGALTCKDVCVNKVKLSRSTLKSSLSTIPSSQSMTTHTKNNARCARARAYLHSTTLCDLSASTESRAIHNTNEMLCASRFQINRTAEYITRSRRRSFSVQLPGTWNTLCSHSIPPATLTPPSSTFVILRQLRSPHAESRQCSSRITYTTLRRNRENAFVRLIVPSHPLDHERLLLQQETDQRAPGYVRFSLTGEEGRWGGEARRECEDRPTLHSHASVGDCRARKSRRSRPRYRARSKTYRAPKI